MIGKPGARLAKGALEGGVGTALVLPAVYSQAHALQQDYDSHAALMDLVFGSAFGAGLHWSGGTAGDLLRGKAATAIKDRLDLARGGYTPADPKPPKDGGGAGPIDRRKIRVQEGENASRVEAMDVETRRNTLDAAVRSVSTDQVPKVDVLLRGSPELRELSIPDKRFPATVRLRTDMTARDYAVGGRSAEVMNAAAEMYAKAGGGKASPERLIQKYTKRYKALGDVSFAVASTTDNWETRARALREHPDQVVVWEPGSKTILMKSGATPLGALRHEIERALDDLYGVTGDARGGYRYSNKDADGPTAHRAALKELYEEAPDRRPKVPSPNEQVEMFSRADDPILGKGGRAAADSAWDVIQDGKDKDLERMIADEEIAVVEDIARNITGEAKDLGIMDKVIPMEERVVLDQAVAKVEAQKLQKNLATAVDKAVIEREVRNTQALEDAEILMRSGPEALRQILLEGRTVKNVIDEGRAELVTRAQAVRSIHSYFKFLGKEAVPPTGDALERAIRAIQDGDDIDVAIQNVTRAGDFFEKTKAAEAQPVGEAADFKAPGEDDSLDDIFGDLTDEVEEMIKGTIAARELAESEARLVKDEHDALAANPKTADLASPVERDEFNEAQRSRALREGPGTLSSGAGGRAGRGGAGAPLEDGLFATRTRRDGEAARGQGVTADREGGAAGGERKAPETTLSIGRDTIPRRVIAPDQSI